MLGKKIAHRKWLRMENNLCGTAMEPTVLHTDQMLLIILTNFLSEPKYQQDN